MTEIKVDAEKMRTAVEKLLECYLKWHDCSTEIQNATLGPDDLGFLGSVFHIPDRYNAVVDQAFDRVSEGENVLRLAGADLYETAKNYDDVEDKNILAILDRASGG
ncbi:hypothetical protein [Actinomadura rupiterrae]|uniref:hypothetical protein n=1 Tax=Actinomadura rupiterrae TaxID=559627 RepID=UPI0020A39501|nr:hypothetical protein [Actinomadura rupiterrae]MCP2337344.1 hypothetical protein [Actinomadura rupiterrae]